MKPSKSLKSLKQSKNSIRNEILNKMTNLVLPALYTMPEQNGNVLNNTYKLLNENDLRLFSIYGMPTG